MTSKQLIFDLPSRTALGRGDFFVSQSNTIALSLIEDWQNWPGGKHTLSGPKGSGKTHLAHVWAEISNANIISAHDIRTHENAILVRNNLVIEDVPDVGEDTAAQEQLFHLHNLFAAEKKFLLFSGRSTPLNWNITLPDLASRLQGARNATLNQPDDVLFSALLAKLFADRQTYPTPDVIQYLVVRLERSFAEAQSFVERFDAAALREKRPMTRSFASKILNTDLGSEY
ncbi:MAG: DnaA/Hda family protein [Paracoccaceae bacterium]|nr:chromosomal replication initiator DnaA [Marinovum sp.]MDG2294359.1 DnaA/Hda family protein [Paracoccaceae bacterium]